MANRYPTVFCHGFMGWGEDDGVYQYAPYWGFKNSRNVMKHLREEGYDVYAPSLGPFNSAWDRACELWAIIMGGTVDYGKVHAEKYGHNRFGRTYPGLIKDWGTPGDHERINIVGHSFGGPTVIVFEDLLTNGSEEERQGTPSEELSPFFLQNKVQKLHTVTTLNGVNNGTTFASFLRTKGVRGISQAVLTLVSVTGNSVVTKYYDFYMDHWDMMENPHTRQKNRFRSPLAIQHRIRRFKQNFFDSIGHEMKLECRQELNKFLKPASDTYFFAHIYDRTHWNEKRGYRVINSDASIIAKVPAPLCSHWGSDDLKKNYGWNLDEWTYHDGLVNVPGQKAPSNLPSRDAETFYDSFEKGIWYNMPVKYGDHMTSIGYGETRESVFRLYDYIVSRAANLD